jgi:tryptophan synthase beta chain
MVRDFQSIIGKETRARSWSARAACPTRSSPAIGGGSNAMGLFHPFLDDKDVCASSASRPAARASTTDGARRLAHRRAPGRAARQPHLPAAGRGRPDPRRHSISAGLDYPGIGPEHSWLHDIGRAEYVSITDTEALEAFQLCCEAEGIIPALEPSHALAHVGEVAQELGKDGLIILNMCGRGDKDVFSVAKHLGVDM